MLRLISLFSTIVILTFSKVFANLYVGIDGGWAWSLSDSDGSHGGLFSNGSSFDVHTPSGYEVGANLGYCFPHLMRFDVSYTYIRSNQFRWKTSFPPTAPFPFQVSTYKAVLESQLVLANAYLHINDLFPLTTCLEPYLGGGVGVAFNNLSHIDEMFDRSLSSTGSRIFSHRHSNIAARVGCGLQKTIFCNWIADLAFYGNYVGTIRSGNQRIRDDSGLQQVIGPYIFRRHWIGTITLGLKYLF